MSTIIQKYFQAFSDKNLAELSKLYDHNIVLWEWAEKIYLGKEEVLAANKNLFDSFKNIVVLLKTIANDNSKFFCEAVITLDDKVISVIDVITIENDKIVSIAAYRGF